MSDVSSLSDSHLTGLTVFYSTISMVLQSVFFGIHFLIVPLGLHIVIKRWDGSRPGVYMLLTMLGPFLLSAIYWTLRLVDLLVQIQIGVVDPAKHSGPNFTKYLALFNAIFLANFLVSDAIVAWRAWAICKYDTPKLLWIPLVSLAMTMFIIISTIGLRIVGVCGGVETKSHVFIDTINVLQLLESTSSSVTNFSATSIVCIKAWHHRRLIQAGIRAASNRRTRTEQILILLIESGLLYGITTGATAIGALIKLPHGTVGDISFPIGLQISGMYPTIVIVLVNLQRPTDITTQWHMTIVPPEPTDATDSQTTSGEMQFARNMPLQ